MTDLNDILGAELEPSERERLEHVHTLLVQAGPPPELPPALEHAPAPPAARVIPFPRRYRFTALAAAAVAACALFGIGYLVGGAGGRAEPVRTVAMSGASQATAQLDLFEVDAAGNWPMELRVAGLPAGRYELWLTRDGKLAETCGVFAVADGETTVPLNAPYVSGLRRMGRRAVRRRGARPHDRDVAGPTTPNGLTPGGAGASSAGAALGPPSRLTYFLPLPLLLPLALALPFPLPFALPLPLPCPAAVVPSLPTDRRSPRPSPSRPSPWRRQRPQRPIESPWPLPPAMLSPRYSSSPYPCTNLHLLLSQLLLPPFPTISPPTPPSTPSSIFPSTPSTPPHLTLNPYTPPPTAIPYPSSTIPSTLHLLYPPPPRSCASRPSQQLPAPRQPLTSVPPLLLHPHFSSPLASTQATSRSPAPPLPSTSFHSTPFFSAAQRGDFPRPPTSPGITPLTGYALKSFDGWVVVPSGDTTPVLTT